MFKIQLLNNIIPKPSILSAFFYDFVPEQITKGLIIHLFVVFEDKYVMRL